MWIRSSRGYSVDRILDFYRHTESDGPLFFWLQEILVALGILVLCWILSRILRYLLGTWGPRFTAFTRSDLDDRILARVTPPASLLVVLAGLYYALGSLPLPERAHVAVSG